MTPESSRSSISERPWYLDNIRLSDIGLDSLQRAKVLEWYAWKIWTATEEGSGMADYGGKSYDPLTIELRSDGGGVAHSYIFNFRDGGRHHSFDSLDNLEDWLLEEAITRCKWIAELGEDDE